MDISYSLQKLKQYIEDEGFKGYDPYDALHSPLLKCLSSNSKLLRIAFIQTFKRLPVNLRPLLFIKKEYNPKAVGLLLWGYAKLYKLENKSEYLEKIKNLLELLEKLKREGYSGNCWGYYFDWQTRASFFPKFTPTTINSSFIGHTLIDVYRYTGIEKALEMAISIKDFILNDLNRTEENGSICFSCTPVDHDIVHNANLLGASLLIRLFKYTKDNNMREVSLSSLDYSMKYQKEDGSWAYGMAGHQGWIDSFHTGLSLWSILYFFEEGFADKHRPAFEKGVEFYSNNFFLDDGMPKYYHDKIYPLDIHAPAQAIVFFLKLGESHRDLSERIIQWMINNLQDRQGFFYLQKKRHYTNKIPYIRGAQAWAFHALTEFKLLNQQ